MWYTCFRYLLRDWRLMAPLVTLLKTHFSYFKYTFSSTCISKTPKGPFGNPTQNTFFIFQTYFFIHMYIKNTQNTLLKLRYQTGPPLWNLLCLNHYWNKKGLSVTFGMSPFFFSFFFFLMRRMSLIKWDGFWPFWIQIVNWIWVGD